MEIPKGYSYVTDGAFVTEQNAIDHWFQGVYEANLVTTELEWIRNPKLSRLILPNQNWLLIFLWPGYLPAQIQILPT